MSSQVNTFSNRMRERIHKDLEMEPTQMAVDEAVAGRSALEAQIGANLSKLAPQDLVSIGWVVEELLDQSTYQ